MQPYGKFKWNPVVYYVDSNCHLISVFVWVTAPQSTRTTVCLTLTQITVNRLICKFKLLTCGPSFPADGFDTFSCGYCKAQKMAFNSEPPAVPTPRKQTSTFNHNSILSRARWPCKGQGASITKGELQPRAAASICCINRSIHFKMCSSAPRFTIKMIKGQWSPLLQIALI